ncbi:MAG: hypothetical protein C6I00_04465 [Nitratiruptor sp.]|nr:hypothetical protein [Nitratiruptor sp.]NPA84343.1 thioredoxin family protein [Campylobacterota bacterium]
MRLLWLFGLFSSLLIASTWYTNFDEAMAKAKEEQKPLFIFFERKNPPCRWCQLMWEKTLQDPKIASFIGRKFILLRLAREEGGYPQELYPRYIPTITILDPQGKRLQTIVGYWRPQDFWSDLEEFERANSTKGGG